MVFDGIEYLNRIQSVVFETAYTTNENLLVCAPTGAGKTNIALLAIVHTIRNYMENSIIKKNEFKVWSSVVSLTTIDQVYHVVYTAKKELS